MIRLKKPEELMSEGCDLFFGEQLPEMRERVERDINSELIYKPCRNVPAHVTMLLIIDLC